MPENEQVVELVEKATRMANKKREEYVEIQRIISEDAPNALTPSPNAVCTKDDIHNVNLSPLLCLNTIILSNI